MSSKAGTLGFSERPALFTFWTVAVSALAASALILSAVALTVAGRDVRPVTSVEGSGTHEASIGATLWDAGKLEAMKGRVLAEAVRTQQVLWDPGKLEAMKGRVLAESARIQDYAPLWDAGKIEAMRGRVLAG
jgi:hypothetical protein